MAQPKWKAKTKRDLIIEVWEHLDCESVGAKEIRRIAEVVRKRFGDGAVESPASIARLLADEGAELRHAEVLSLDAQVREFDQYGAVFKNVLKFADFEQAAATLKRLESLRRHFKSKGDVDGLRLVRETAQKGKERALMISRNAAVDQKKRDEKAEIAEWFAVWQRQPEIFADWVELRRRSKEFRKKFTEPAV